MKDNGRPKLGYSSIHWSRIDREKRKTPVIVEEEILEEPTIIPMEQKND